MMAVSRSDGVPEVDLDRRTTGSNEFTVSEEDEGERLDKLLVREITGYSRNYLTNLLKEGNVLLNGRKAKPSARVKEDDLVAFTIPEKILPDILPEDIPLDILYEDSDVLVVNKPKGMVVHPAPGHYTGTLVNAVMYHCRGSLSGINGVLRPGIVHASTRIPRALSLSARMILRTGRSRPSSRRIRSTAGTRQSAMAELRKRS